MALTPIQVCIQEEQPFVREKHAHSEALGLDFVVDIRRHKVADQERFHRDEVFTCRGRRKGGARHSRSQGRAGPGAQNFIYTLQPLFDSRLSGRTAVLELAEEKETRTPA